MKQKEVPEMDDVEKIISKISEESPYRRRPTQKRTWMIVPEMGKLSRNEKVSLDVLVKICRRLNCTFDDIIDIVPENTDNNK